MAPRAPSAATASRLPRYDDLLNGIDEFAGMDERSGDEAERKPDAEHVESLEAILKQIDQEEARDSQAERGNIRAAGDAEEFKSLESILRELDRDEAAPEDGSEDDDDDLPDLVDPDDDQDADRQLTGIMLDDAPDMTAVGLEEPPLAIAVQTHDLFQAQALLRDRSDPNTRGRDGQRLLRRAARTEDLNMVALLLGWGASSGISSSSSSGTQQEIMASFSPAVRAICEIFESKEADSAEKRDVLASLDPGVLAQARAKLLFKGPFKLGGASPAECLSAGAAVTVLPGTEDHTLALHLADPMRPVLVLMPQRRQPTALVVLLHGLFQSGYMLEQLARELSWALPHACILAPTAPTRGSIFGYGPTWFELGDPTLTTPAQETTQHMESMRSELLRLLGQHGHGLPPERVVLAGFSMGGSVAAYTALQVPRKFAGLILLGSEGFGPTSANLQSGLAKGPAWTGADGLPVLHCHGDSDKMVPLERARAASNMLARLGCQVRFSPHEGVGHFLSPAMIAEMLAWLSVQLPEED